MQTSILTDDGRFVRCGEQVYDYYTMEPVTILSDPDDQGWFRVSGSAKWLNGQRICTMETAKRRNFPNS